MRRGVRITLGQRLLGVRQTDAGRLLLAGHFADDGIDAGIGAEPQDVLIAGQFESVPGLRHRAGTRAGIHKAFGDMELKFREAVVDLRRGLVLRQPSGQRLFASNSPPAL